MLYEVITILESASRRQGDGRIVDRRHRFPAASRVSPCSMYGMDCTVYMVKVSYNQKPYRKMLINAYGGEIFASPSEMTRTGRARNNFV